MELLWEIEVYLRRTGVPATRFGRASCRDPRLVHDLRRGRTPGERLCARVRAVMATNPEGLA